MTRAIYSVVFGLGFGVLGVFPSFSIAHARKHSSAAAEVDVKAAVAVPALPVPAVPPLPAVGVNTSLSLQGAAGVGTALSLTGAAPVDSAAEPAPAPLIPGLSPKAQKLWTAGKVLNGIGAGIGLAGSGLAGASGVITGIYGLNDTSTVGSLGPLFTQIGSGVNMGSLALNVAALGLQHSALASAGSDPNRKKFVGGIVMGALGLAGVITGFIFGGMKDNPNASTIAFAVTNGGTSLLTTSNSIFLADGVATAKAYKAMFAPPTLPGVPNLNGVPMPGMPNLPVQGMPNVPMPGMPNVPVQGMPNVPAQGMPQMPQ